EMVNPPYKLWLLLEEDPSPIKFGFTQDDVGIENPDLSDLAEVLCNKNERLKELKVRPNKLEFFGEASSGECCGTAVRMTRAVTNPFVPVSSSNN
ncbi:6577_t:CDS:1, partial [Paraglomus brasilianum]